jgi:hypothetical protein
MEPEDLFGQTLHVIDLCQAPAWAGISRLLETPFGDG